MSRHDQKIGSIFSTGYARWHVYLKEVVFFNSHKQALEETFVLLATELLAFQWVKSGHGWW
jgi:hypothetical protein